MYFWIGFICLFVLYLLYIQFSPSMGNIWYRNNEYFSFMGAWNVIVFPLQCKEMWYFKMWDINFFLWVIFYFMSLLLFHNKYLCNHLDLFQESGFDDKTNLLKCPYE